jgi:hypothetical protein
MGMTTYETTLLQIWLVGRYRDTGNERLYLRNITFELTRLIQKLY